VKKLCPFAESICPNPLDFPQAKGELMQSSWRTKEEEEPRIRIKERWPVSILIVS
jgi:hypothetical protein